MIPLHPHVYHISMEAYNLDCHHKLWEWGQGRPMQMHGEERKEKSHKEEKKKQSLHYTSNQNQTTNKLTMY